MSERLLNEKALYSKEQLLVSCLEWRLKEDGAFLISIRQNP
ncbi:hypothetical protein SD77_2112 [Bacillus badius]|uniref:Uncharacterized protein n=1 Tax=Bacillus badius TaxID=1455 RepID=A0ABR5AY39_BACBA|nr:hypothetical protein SD78_2423 [Bacillus badius]KIL79658.1 hypothetical protein SD77_2112 [Bacillus badius]